MTVRAKIQLAKDLARNDVNGVWAKCQNFAGTLMVQAEVDGVLVHVPIQGSSPAVNLLATAPASAWKKSNSLLGAVLKGYLTVSVERR
jgi:hypothetical protein